MLTTVAMFACVFVVMRAKYSQERRFDKERKNEIERFIAARR